MPIDVFSDWGHPGISPQIQKLNDALIKGTLILGDSDKRNCNGFTGKKNKKKHKKKEVEKLNPCSKNPRFLAFLAILLIFLMIIWMTEDIHGTSSKLPPQQADGLSEAEKR